jgi:hypothetical protein
MPISNLPSLCRLIQNCSRSQWPRQVRNCAYHNGDGAIPDTLIVVEDAHPLQPHEPAVGVAVHHFKARVLHYPPNSPRHTVRVTSSTQPSTWKPVSGKKNIPWSWTVMTAPAARFIIDTIRFHRRREVPVAQEAFRQEAQPQRRLRQGPRSEAAGMVEEAASAMAADLGTGGAGSTTRIVWHTPQREG